MAYVAFTKTLLSDVHSHIDALRIAEHTLLSLSADAAGHAVADDEKLLQQLYTRLWGEELDLEPRLNKYNVKRPWYVRVRTGNETPSLALGDQETPCFRTGYNEFFDVSDENEARQFPTIAAWLDALEHERDINKRWATVREQVMQFFDRCKSLNEAVKLWPDVKRFVPQSYLDKLEEKVSKKSKTNAAAALQGIDTQLIETSTVLAVMGGAKV